MAAVTAGGLASYFTGGAIGPTVAAALNFTGNAAVTAQFYADNYLEGVKEGMLADKEKYPDGVTDEDDLNIDNIEVLGYKKSKKSKSNFESIIRMESNLESIIEATYKEYKNDDSMKAHQKVNTSIKEINRLMWEITKIVNQNSKLKTETGVHTGQYWKSTQKRFGKISERMLKVARQLKELSA